MNNNLKKFLPIDLDKFGFVEREKVNNKTVKNRCGRDFLYYSLNYYYPNKFNSNKCNPVQIEKQKIFGLPLPSWLVWTCLPFYKIPKLFRDNNLVLYINDIKIDSFIKFVRVIMFPPKLSFTDCLNKIINSVNDGVVNGVDISLGFGGLYDHVLFVYGYDESNLYVFDTHVVDIIDYKKTTPDFDKRYIMILPINEIKKRWTRFGRFWEVKSILTHLV
jgi:hypothetical protein